MRSRYLPLIRCRMNVSAAATVVKNVASFGALALRCAAGNGAIMLDDASIIRQMRRPGYDTSSRVSEVYGSASASVKNGRPARNSSSAPWRTIAVQLRPLQSSTAGSATCVRPAFFRVSARPTRMVKHNPISATMARIAVSRWVNSSVRGARVAPLHHDVAQRRRELGQRDHARVSPCRSHTARREPLHHPGLIEPRAFQHLVAGVERLVERAVIQLAVAAVLRRGQRRQRLLQRFVELRSGKARRPRPSNPIAADGLRRDGAGDRHAPRPRPSSLHDQPSRLFSRLTAILRLKTAV